MHFLHLRTGGVEVSGRSHRKRSKSFVQIPHVNGAVHVAFALYQARDNRNSSVTKPLASDRSLSAPWEPALYAATLACFPGNLTSLSSKLEAGERMQQLAVLLF